MKLLVITQKINRDDPVLGFFHNWLEKFSNKFDKITAICLELGKSDLPNNVKVLSLGKEQKRSRLKYVWQLAQYLWQERKNYDAVFVHMNQEYILLAGWWWRLTGKKVYMWRNHHAGGFLTDVAVWFCAKVFCTSKFSYTAKYKKTVLMPVGIDTDLFKPDPGIVRQSRSILFLARMAPVKKPDVLIKALSILCERGVSFSADFYGDPAPTDEDYYKKLKMAVESNKLNDRVRFLSGVPNHQAAAIFNSHDIFVNLSSSGMYDKTIFEAMACETIVLNSNNNLRGLIDESCLFKEADVDDLAWKLEQLLNLSDEDKSKQRKVLRDFAQQKHSLEKLALELSKVVLFPHEC